MGAFLVRRLTQGLIVVGLAATIVFFLVHLAPGDPFAGSVDHSSLTPAVRAQMRAAYGLDQSLPRQYVLYISNVARGDLGFSFSMLRPVRDVLADALPNTLMLMSVALILSFATGIIAALAQVKRRGRVAGSAIGGIALVLLSIPDFLLAMLVLTIFPYLFPAFPIGGSLDSILYDSLTPAERIVDRIKHLVLPAMTLGLLYFPIIARHQRAALLDVLPSDFIAVARAKGVTEARILNRHALRNALLPVVSILGVAFPVLLTGAVFVEKVFSWPGMGLVIVNAISSRDFPLVTAAVLMGSGFVVIGSIIADSLYRLLDPRLRSDR